MVQTLLIITFKSLKSKVGLIQTNFFFSEVFLTNLPVYIFYINQTSETKQAMAPSSSSQSNPKMKLKLFLDTSNNQKKVLYGEAGKDFVDFLIYLLTLPLSTVFKVLKDNDDDKLGSLSHFYESLENLPESYLHPSQNKSSLLNPRIPVYTTGIPVTLSDYDFKNRKFYQCFSKDHRTVSEVPDLICPGTLGASCQRKMEYSVTFVPPPQNGFVKGLVHFIVTDNLEIIPMSAKHLFNLLDKLHVKNLGDVEIVALEMGVEEVI